MSENVDQPKQERTEASNAFPSVSGSLSNQDPLSSVESPYEETHVPYLPLPSERNQPPSPAPGVGDAKGADNPSPSLSADTAPTSPGSSGVGVLIGIVLGALLGGVVGHFTGASLVIGASIGAAVGGVLALLPHVVSEVEVPWLLSEGLSAGLGEMLNCCLTSAILVVGSVVTISGLVLWQH